MNEQPANRKNRGQPIGADETFVPRTLLDYAAPRAATARGPIRLPSLVGDLPSYGVSTISIFQNNYYHGIDHEYPYDHIHTFLQCLGAVYLNGASEDYIRLSLFPYTLKDRAKR
jgi:hypothetical protein